MPTPTLNFDMHAGDSKLLRITVTDASTGAVFNLTGCSAIWEASRELGASPFTFYSDPVVSKSTTDGIAITDPTNGILEITLASVDTRGFQGNYYHELSVTDTSGNEQTVLVGTIAISKTLIVSL